MKNVLHFNLHFFVSGCPEPAKKQIIHLGGSNDPFQGNYRFSWLLMTSIMKSLPFVVLFDFVVASRNNTERLAFMMVVRIVIFCLTIPEEDLLSQVTILFSEEYSNRLK